MSKTIGRSMVIALICQSSVSGTGADPTPAQKLRGSFSKDLTTLNHDWMNSPHAQVDADGDSGQRSLVMPDVCLAEGPTAMSPTNITTEPSHKLIEEPSHPLLDAGNDTTSARNDASKILASASTDHQMGQRIEFLTKQIAKKETELLRLNTNFRVECTRVSKWKPWRLFLYNLGASGSSNAGITSISATRWKYRAHPKLMTRSTAGTGPLCLFIGHCIILGGILAETTLDVRNDHKVKNKGFDIKTTHRRVLDLKGELDKLLSEREAVLAENQELSSGDLELAMAETRVLHDVKDLALNEYSQFFVRAHRFFGNRLTNSLLSVAASSTGGFQGSLLGTLSAYGRRPRLVGPGGIGFIISGATIAATPTTANFVAHVRGNLARKRISSELNNQTIKSVSELDADRAKLEQLASRTESSSDRNLTNLSRRLSAYSMQNSLFTAQSEINAREKSLANSELKERMLFASLIGGTKISWGTNLVNAGFSYHPRSVLALSNVKGKLQTKVIADPEPSKLFTRRVAIAATTYVPGTGAWILDTLQNRIRGEVRNHALARQKNLPGALMKERLDRVEEIDEVFNY